MPKKKFNKLDYLDQKATYRVLEEISKKLKCTYWVEIYPGRMYTKTFTENRTFVYTNEPGGIIQDIKISKAKVKKVKNPSGTKTIKTPTRKRKSNKTTKRSTRNTTDP